MRHAYQLMWLLTAMPLLFFLSSCSKQAIDTQRNQAHLANSISDTVLTPFGRIQKSHLFIIPPGYHIKVSNGSVWKVSSKSGALAEKLGDYSAPVEMATPSKTDLFSTVKTKNKLLAVPAETNFVTYSQWENTTGQPISSFITGFTVPENPTSTGDQIIFIFEGLSGPAQTDMIQPVLEWGIPVQNGSSGNYWSILSAYGWQDQQGNIYGAETNSTQVNAGAVLQGVITLLSIGSDGSYTYESTIGTNSLTVEEGNPSTTNPGLKIPFVNQAVYAYEVLESNNLEFLDNGLGVYQLTNYPPQYAIRLDGINMTTGSSPAPISWTTVINPQARFSEHTVIASNNSHNDGEVDLWFQSPIPFAPTINGTSSIQLYTFEEGTNGWYINALPGHTVNVILSASATGPRGIPGSQTETLNITTPGVTFSNGSTTLTVSNGTISQTIVMPANVSVVSGTASGSGSGIPKASISVN